jgi:uncharacterized membrane protein AbrB (regulator of aidB expression)
MDSLLYHIPSLLVLLSLRCFLPLAITLVVAWLLKRWEKRNETSSVTGAAIKPGLSDSSPYP